MKNKKTDTYGKVFLEQAELGFLEFNYRYMETDKMKVLRERQRTLNEAFVYTPTVREKVINLQNVYTQKCREALENVIEIEECIKARMDDTNGGISDYTIEFEVQLFSPEKYKHIPEMDGYSFYNFSMVSLSEGKDMFENNDVFDFDLSPSMTHLLPSFKALTPNHPLQGIDHNILMYELFNHTILAYTDILETESVWIEAKICVQKKFDL